jgi:hypothetical protein
VGQLPQRLDADLRIVAASSQPFDELLNVISEDSRLDILPDEFSGRGISHPLFSLMKWYMKSRGAVCLTTGVGLRKNMGVRYQLENDHIFPFSRLKAVGYGKSNHLKYALAQEMTNRAVLTQLANRTKSTEAAADYLAEVQRRMPDALRLQCIPEDAGLWQIERYEDFIRERRHTLAGALNQFLSGITATVEVSAPIELEELISAGENDETEFKASLRWDYRQGKVTKVPHDEVIETVAAFANADGGLLLIGVDASGAAIGLENDYASLGADADKDEFQRNLLDLLKDQFGEAFVSNKLKITFPVVAGREICQVEVARASEPMVVKVRNQDGQKVERFFVRIGNTSQNMPLSEMNSYVRERFH